MQTPPAVAGPPVDDRPGPRRLAAALLVTVVAALLILPAVGRQVLTSSDEARFVLLARDMLDRGVWFDAAVRDKQYRNKPPLYPWSIVVAARLTGGVTEFAAGLPVAIAAIGTVLATFLLGDRLFGWRVGATAGLVLATTYGFFQHSLELLPDMLVLAFVTLAGWAFWRSTAESGDRWRAVFWAAVGLAVFSKGPLGLLPLAPLAVWLLAVEGRAGLLRLWSPLGLALFAGTTLLWMVPFLMLGAGSFGETVVWTDWLDWYFGAPRLRRLDTLLDLALGLVPWTFAAPLAVAAAWRSRREPAVRFALLWCLVPLLVVIVSENVRRRYLLPVYPGAALLVAWWAVTGRMMPSLGGRIMGWAALGASVAAVTALLWAGSSDQFLPPPTPAAAPLYAAILLLGLCFFHALRRARPRLLLGSGIILTLAVLGWGVWPYIRWVNSTQDFRGLATLVDQHARGGPVAVYGGRFFELDYYLGRYLVRLRSAAEFREYLSRADAPLVVVDGRAWRELQGQMPPSVRVLATMHVRSWDMRLLRAEGTWQTGGRSDGRTSPGPPAVVP